MPTDRSAPMLLNLRKLCGGAALLGVLLISGQLIVALFEEFSEAVLGPMTAQGLVPVGGVPNVVTPIILDLRLYDTVGEVIVFTLASLGVHALIRERRSSGEPSTSDDLAVTMQFRIAAVLNGLIAVELALRGHLSPGGGFAAGVAGGTAIALVLLVGGSVEAKRQYRQLHAGVLEESAVLVFIILSCLIMEGLQLPMGIYGQLLSGGMLPVLNVLVGVKVTLGSWGMIQRFLGINQLI